MNIWTRRGILKAGAAGLALSVVGGRLAIGGEAELLIGASLSFSGSSFYVEDSLRQLLGYRLWQEQVNARGGLLGRKVGFVVRDDASTPEGGAAAYRALLAEDGVDLVIGNYGSRVAAGTVPVVEERGLPCIFPMSWAPQVWNQPRRWSVPLLPLATAVTEPLVAYLRRQGVRSVSLPYADNSYARDLAEGLVAWLADYGIALKGEHVYGGGSGQSLEAAVKAAAADGPDAIVGGNVGAEVPELARAARAAPKEIGTHAWFEVDEPEILPHREAVQGMVGFGLWIPSLPTPGNRDFVDGFTRRWQSEYPDIPISLLVDHHSAAGYGAAQALERAAQAAGTVQPAVLRDALFGLDTTTVFGRFKLDGAARQVGKIVPVVGYRHGLREVLWPEDLATVSG